MIIIVITRRRSKRREYGISYDTMSKNNMINIKSWMMIMAINNTPCYSLVGTDVKPLNHFKAIITDFSKLQLWL